jgi:hypothetical protein
MSAGQIETDYLVVGAGATAMAFVDTLLTENPRARVMMVDRRGHAGGHWNDAYSFVQLHQPAAWYGVPSRQLAAGTTEAQGPNKGMQSLATKPEVLAHFAAVMRDRFLPSGRVSWLPKTEWLGGESGVHRLRSLTSGETLSVRVHNRLVNATHARTEIPATHAPRYRIADGVRVVPPNALTDLNRPSAHYTVVGSGKTGMDSCIWLLEQGVAPERIRWIMPRDAWLMDRSNLQTGAEGFEAFVRSSIDQFEAITQANSLPELLHILETRGVLMRIDPSVEPTTYRCAVVSRGELQRLRSIRDVVRLGHVHSIEPTRLVLERGELTADPDTLYVNCTAGAIQLEPKLPIFDTNTINLLLVRWCQPLFSAAVIAWVEAHGTDDAARNALCHVVPVPEVPLDWLRMWAMTMQNEAAWRNNEPLKDWLSQCRLNSQHVMLQGVEINDAIRQRLGELVASSAAAGARLPQLMRSLR